MPRKQITYSSHPTHRARMVHAQGERHFKTYDTSHIRPQKSKAPMIVAAVLAVVVLALAAFALTTLMRGCSSQTAAEVDGDQVVVSADVSATVAPGSTADEVASALQSAGAVPNPEEFLARAKTLGADSKFQAGTYSFSAGMTLDEVINAVATGNLGTVSLTIPEGYKLADIAATVEQVTGGDITAADFEAAASDASAYAADYDFLADAGGNSLEGFLFPKTYALGTDATADSVIRMMLDQFRAEFSSVDTASAKGIAFADGSTASDYDILIIASMIEREAQLDDERPLVASVIYNRLVSDMPLQIDATTAYVYGTDFTPEQLHEEGPYNTYDKTGLPAGPICSPGAASLVAASSPATTDYLYYVTKGDGSGGHNFAATYDEHQQNIVATSNG